MKVTKDEQLTIVANLCIYKYKKHYNPRQIQEVNLKLNFKVQKY